MDADTPMPRLRMSRHSPVQYDRSSNVVSISEAGPSRLPNFSQIIDFDMKDMPLSDDHFSSSDLNIPKTTATSAATRPDNPAAVLRALLSRLPPSPTQSRALSVNEATERESDFDTVSESNAVPSVVQNSLKHIFSKALRDTGNTPQKARRRSNSIDASEVEASPRVEKERATNKGKRRSMSDDEVEHTSQTINRRNIRLKSTPQPITMEFLRERFSDSHNLRTSIAPRSPPVFDHDSSNDTATIFRDLNSSQATPPAATSTPHQSLRLSTGSRFQFHSNLLDQDSEMQKAIEGLDSYDESVTHGSTSRGFNFPKALQTSPVLRHHSSTSDINPEPTPSNNHNLTCDQSHSMDDLRTPSQHRGRFYADTSRSPSPALQANSHHNETNVVSNSSHLKSSKDRSHSEQHLRSEVQSSGSRLSPFPRTEFYRHHSPSSRTNSSVGSLRNHDDDYVDIVYERQRNWNSPHPIWHKPPPSPKGRGASSSAPSPLSTDDHVGMNGFRTFTHVNEHRRDHYNNMDTSRISNSTTTNVQERSPRLLSPPPIRTISLESKPPSPPKGLPDLPTPSSSDESDYDSPRSNAVNRLNDNNQSASLTWMSAPKSPGGCLNTPKQITDQSSPIGNVTLSNGDTPLAIDSESPYLKTPARAEVAHGFQSFTKTPKPPGGWVSTPAPAPIPAPLTPVDSPPDTPERNQGLLTPVASLSKGSKLEPKTPTVPGAWLATPAVKKSILKVRFEPEDSKSTDKLVGSTKHSNLSSESRPPIVDIEDDGSRQTAGLLSKSPASPRRQRSPRSPKIRVLDAFGREQEPDVSNQKRVNDSPSPFRVLDAMGHEVNDGNIVEGIKVAVTPSYSTSSRGELLSRIRNGLDDLVIGLDDFDKDDQALSIDHERVQQLTTISRRARGLRDRLHSQVDSSRSFLSNTLGTTKSWFSTKPKVYIFLIILQLSLIWLMYRISFNWAQELFLNTYYDPFNPELHLYAYKFKTSPHVLLSEGVKTTSLVGYIWGRWTHFTRSITRFGQVWDKGAVLQYDNTWTPT